MPVTASTHKIFISHSSKDIKIIDEFVKMILRLGLGISNKEIFCSSIEGMGIRSGKDFRKEIKNKISTSTLVLIMLSKNYKESEICLNEMGAAWVLGKQVIPIIIPPLNFSEVGILQSTTQIEKINTGPGIDKIGDALIEILKIVPANNIPNWNKQRTEFLKCFEVEAEDQPIVNGEIQMIKKEFSISDNGANIIWHLGTNTKKFRSQDTLIKKTGFTASQIDEIVRTYPVIFYRGKGKLGRSIYRLQDSSKEKFLKISFNK